MKLLPNWKTLIRKAWSIRLMILAGALSAAEIVLPMFADSIPRGVFAIMTTIAVAGAFIARLIAQKEVSNGNDQ